MFESELPGPEVNQLAERIRDTARRLWLLYIALTLVLFGSLLAIGLSGIDDAMGPFNALAYSLTHAAARRIRPRQSLPRALRPAHAMGRRRSSWRSRD